ncbi:AAA family ATPase [Mesomycoplasma conjunctivae]|uniref:AAA family ATPase n=1 Tax=Mesomycoplasma conjunctivae TaxID=45361 RepID=UPI003DA28276
MKLIKIEIEGFKSFADPVSIAFDGSVVGIVGPNGSGKSNINDAIRWVLGEKSAKQLRGSNMDDVIFAGSKTVKPLDKAMVRLTFEDKSLEDESSRVFTVARVLKRGQGSNEYLYNNQPVRYKDIRNLAVNAGISKSSLAIISQGTISEIAEATPEQRKAVIEEVAGTAKYKLDKQEALTKLEQTKTAIEKIEIKVRELERQSKNLEKQAENAKIYLEKSSALESVEVALIVNDLNDYNAKLTSLKQEISVLSQDDNSNNLEYEKNQQVIVENTNIKQDLEKKISNIKNEIYEIKKELDNINIEEAKAQKFREMVLSGEIEVNFEQKIAALKREYVQIEERIKNTNSQILTINDQKTKQQSQYKIYNDKRIEIESTIRRLISERSKNEAQILQLQKVLETKAFLSKGTKTIIDNSFLFSGFCGLVTDLIKYDSQYANAVEAAIGPALKQIVVEKPEDAVEAVNFLKKNMSGTATFIPLTSIKPRYVHETHMLALRGQKGFINIAYNLISSEQKYTNLVDFLLATIIVVDNIENANRIAKIIDFKYVIVTLEGDIVRPSGTITGGHRQKVESSTNIEFQIDELKSKIEFYNKKEQELDLIKHKNETEISELATNINNLDIKLSNLNLSLSELKDKLYKIQIENKEYLNIQSQQSDSDSIIEKSFEAKLQLENKISFLEIDLKTQNEKLDRINEQINQLSILNQQLGNQQRKTNNALNDKKNDLNKVELILDNLNIRLTQKYNLTFEAASQNYILDIEISDARKFVKQLNDEIKALGNVNLDAIDDFQETQQRFEKLQAHHEELETAKSKILEAISDLDKIIINKTVEVVDLVNSEFNLVFQNMFGGGSAKIFFSDKNDILNSGIEISAQPPGKTIKNLKLFSGGEKAIIAISLLFSIIKAKPIPLCILDEVEAALDEANVIRYVEFLKQLKENTQFLIITHRHGTMSRVEQLLGVTMQKRGVTSIFSIELSKAKSLLKDEMQ